MHEEDEKAAEKLADEGVTLVNWSDDDKTAFRAAAVDVWTDFAKRSDLAQKALDSQMTYMRGLGLIE